jgi:hypothetical protein
VSRKIFTRRGGNVVTAIQVLMTKVGVHREWWYLLVMMLSFRYSAWNLQFLYHLLPLFLAHVESTSIGKFSAL